MHIVTDGESMVIYMKADLPQWGEVWFNGKVITNIFSYAKRANRYRITFNSEKEDAYIVHMPDKPVRFKRVGMNLHAFKPPKSMVAENAQLFNTVNENKTFYIDWFSRNTRSASMTSQCTFSIHDLGQPCCMNTVTQH